VKPALRGPVRAVLFDVDGTLYWQPPLRLAMGCEMMLASMTRRRTRPLGRDDLRLVLTFRRLREQLRSYGGSEPLAIRQYTAVSERVGCPVADVEAAVAEWIYRRPLKWVRLCRRRGLDQLFGFLAARGVSCGVFSDYPVHEKLAALGISARFDVLLTATDQAVGAFKPDPRGYLAASRQWGIPPDQIVYVGDRSEIDAAGARSAGMQCAVLSRHRPNADFVSVSDFKELQRVLDPVC
jgi:HAD superfamily hydrolase (TIGR01549 family)